MKQGPLTSRAIRWLTWRRAIFNPVVAAALLVLWSPFMLYYVADIIAVGVFGYYDLLGYRQGLLGRNQPIAMIMYMIGMFLIVWSYSYIHYRHARATLCLRCGCNLRIPRHHTHGCVRCPECNFLTDIDAYRQAFPPGESSEPGLRSADDLRRMVVRREYFSRWTRTALATLTLIMLLPGLALLEAWYPGPPSKPIFGFALTPRAWMCAAAALCAAAILLALRRAYVRRRYRRDVLCSRCAFSLRETPADATGIMLCPECGLNVDIAMYRSVFPALPHSTTDRAHPAA